MPGTRLPALVLPVPFTPPVHNVPPASQPSGSAAPVPSVPPASQPSGSAAPVPNVPPASQLLNPPTQYSLWTEESDPQATPVRVQESEYKDDFAQQHVLRNLQKLGEARHEVMVIQSQLDFGNYLNKPSYAAAAAHLPRPTNLDPSYHRGDFDVLVIHRNYGILVGELKAVGRKQPGVSRTQAPADNLVAKRVWKAVKQLDKSETVMKHLVGDIAPNLTIRKALFLPYVGRTQLLRVLTANPQLEQVNTPTHTHTHTHARTHARTHAHTHMHTLTRTIFLFFCSPPPPFLSLAVSLPSLSVALSPPPPPPRFTHVGQMWNQSSVVFKRVSKMYQNGATKIAW